MSTLKKRTIKVLTLALVGTLGFIMSLTSLSAAKANKSLWVPLYNQGKTNWCWATSAKMIGGYLYGSRGTVSDIVYQVTGSRDTRKGGSSTETVKAVNYASNNGNNYISKNGALGYWQFATSINNGKPFILLFFADFPNGRGGHAIVGRGYDWVENNTSNDFHMFYFNDPNGFSQYVEFSSMIGGENSVYKNVRTEYSIVAKGKY